MKLLFPFLLVCLESLAYVQSASRARPQPSSNLHQQPAQKGVVENENAFIEYFMDYLGFPSQQTESINAYAIRVSESIASDWVVGSIKDCHRETSNPVEIGSQLACYSEPKDPPCTREFTDREEYSVSTTAGFQWEFEKSVGGTIKLVEVRSTFKFGSSYSKTSTVTTGRDNKYIFPVPGRKACTPTKLEARMSCKGDVYTVDSTQANTVLHQGGCANFNINFSRDNIFKGTNKPRHFYYVAGNNLIEMVSTSDFPPSSCATVVGRNVWVRKMVRVETDSPTEQPIFNPGRHPISSVACVLKDIKE